MPRTDPHGVPPYRRAAGFALLEVLIALTILASAGITLIGLLDAGIQAETRTRSEESTLAAADRLLTATTLLTRTDLDQRLGHHDVGEFRITIQRPEPTLYRISLAETRAPNLETLVTVVYRPEPKP
jgi:prepilin-type N-terminal cleavage/methylation domain-containing protein